MAQPELDDRPPTPAGLSAAGARPVLVPLRHSAGAGALAMAALGIGSTLGGLTAPDLTTKLIVGALAIAFIVLGVVAVRSAAAQIARAAARASAGAASTTKLLCELVGYLVVVLGVLGLLTIPVQQLLLGGAVTGVVVGIAAQQPLSNLFAGLVLLFARPMVAGQAVCIHSGALGGPLEGTVAEIGLIYTTLDAEGEAMHIPNSALLGAAVRTRADP